MSTSSAAIAAARTRWPGGGYLTERWRKPLAAYADWVPIDFLLAWIDVESGGRLDEVSSIGERSLFQIHPDEIPMLGITQDEFERLTTDPNLSLKVGVREAKKYAAYAKKFLADVGSEWHGRDFWKITKLNHAAFAVPKYTLLAFQRANGRGPATWSEFMDWALNAAANGDEIVPGDPTFSARIRSLIPKTFANAEKTGELSQVPVMAPSTVAIVSNLFRAYQLMI